MNLDKSLDEILDTKKGGRGGGRRGNKAAASAPTGPSGGIRKRSTRSQRNPTTTAATSAAATAAVTAPASGRNEQNDTKILVSLLPHDVSEAQIKDYFGKTIGAIKRCQLIYGPSGVSRGMATLEFSKAGDANLAYQKYNGIVVDKRPIKVEIVVDPSRTPFASRVQAPKQAPAPVAAANKPRSAAVDRSKKNERGGRGGRASNTRRGGAAGGGAAPGPKKSRKTADELDAEMADYFNTGTDSAGADASAAPAAAAL